MPQILWQRQHTYVRIAEGPQSFVVLLAGRVPERDIVIFAVYAHVAGVIVEHLYRK